MRRRRAAAVVFFVLAMASIGKGGGLSVRGVSSQEVRLPASLEAERAVLGAALLEGDAVFRLIPVLSPRDFSTDAHRRIFTHLIAMAGSGATIDLVTLTDSLTRSGELDSVGGAAYLAYLMDANVRGASNIPHWAAIVKEKSRRRSLILAFDDLLQKAQDESRDSRELVNSSVDSLLAIAEGDGSQTGAREFSEVVSATIQELDREITNPDSVVRIYTGLKAIDDPTGGFWGGEIVVTAAPTSHGKTLLGQEIALHSARQGRKGIFFSAEMRAEELLRRELAWEARVPFGFLRHPESLGREHNRDKQEALLAAASRLRQVKGLEIVDEGITPESVWARCEARARCGGLDFAIVDFDQLVIDAGMDSGEDDKFFAAQRRFMHGIKRLTRRLGIVFILLAQFRKMPPGVLQDGKPSLDDLYGDSSVRNLPQTILFFFRKFFLKKMDPKYERDVFGWIMKHRAGRTGKFALEFDREYVRLLDPSPSRERQLEEESTEEEAQR